jgi:HemY protein
MEAVKLAPTLVPAAVLASKYQSEAHQIRRSMRIIETAWLKHPHPDLADAYAHVRLGDSARQRLVRVETLAAKAPGHIESALAVARAAIDASEFARAREVLTPFTDAPTQRVALLMAEIERTEHGDSGRARAWTLRAVRARHDPVWTADGYVSDKWRPVSPVTGRLDAFQWQTPLAALPSDKSEAIEAREFEAKEFNAAMSAPHRVEPPRAPEAEVAAPPAAQDNLPANALAKAPAVEPAPAAVPEPAPSPPPAELPSMTAAPLFRARTDIPRDNPRAASSGIPPVIPIIRPPDDPGIDDEPVSDEFAEQVGPAQGQAGGWRGFLARWGS